MLSLVLAAVWLFVRRSYLLEYFYFSQLLAITHLFTLGFLSSLMMGVLHRLGPAMLGIHPRSLALSRVQFALLAVGAWGMVAHFWLDEPRGMSWATFLVWGASLVQLWNFRDAFTVQGRNRWPARFVAAALVYFALAATLGILLGLVKGYGVAVPVLSDHHLDNVFAHAHLAGIGWVAMMIVGVELKLVPTTVSIPGSVPFRFALLQLGTLGVAWALMAGRPSWPFVLLLAAAFGWQVVGPARAFAAGRAREWELLPLGALLIATALGLALSLGWPGPADPLRGRIQLAICAPCDRGLHGSHRGDGRLQALSDVGVEGAIPEGLRQEAGSRHEGASQRGAPRRRQLGALRRGPGLGGGDRERLRARAPRGCRTALCEHARLRGQLRARGAVGARRPGLPADAGRYREVQGDLSAVTA